MALVQPPQNVEILPICDLPEITPSSDLASLICERAAAHGSLHLGDILVIAQKVISKAEGRRIRLTDVTPSGRAIELAVHCKKDPRLVELILGESDRVVRCAPNVLIVRHLRGYIVANAGIDQSNIEDGDAYALLLPEDPDTSAAVLRERCMRLAGVSIGLVINDSFGRPWRRGTCGVAIGAAGIPSLVDLRGQQDRFGRKLRTSELALADELAAAGSLVMGQAAESVPVVIIRGFRPRGPNNSASALVRPPEENLFL